MIDVLFLVLPETLLLDLAGPAEAFRLANQQLAARGRPPAFALRYISAQPEASTSIGLQLAGLEPLPADAAARRVGGAARAARAEGDVAHAATQRLAGRAPLADDGGRARARARDACQCARRTAC